MPKFDVVVGNPPYKSGMHLSFLQIAYNISKKYVIWISPSTWILDEKGKDKKAIKIRKLINNHVKNITLFNGNRIFNIGLFLPFSIVTIIKNEEKEKIKVENKVIGNIEKYETIEDINKWNDLKIYPHLKEKILSYNDNLLNYKNKINGDYYINLPLIRGHIYVSENTSKMTQDDFYSFFPKDIKIEKKIKMRFNARTGSQGSYINKDKNGLSFFFTFKSENEAQHFIAYLKTQFAMFALSIYKNNSNLDRAELKSVPWLDFSQEWTDKKLYEYFKLSKEEIKFIETNIPKYYE